MKVYFATLSRRSPAFDARLRRRLRWRQWRPPRRTRSSMNAADFEQTTITIKAGTALHLVDEQSGTTHLLVSGQRRPVRSKRHRTEATVT